MDVSYQVPTDPNEARIAELETRLNATAANLSAVWNAILGFAADLASTQAELSAASARVTALQAQVDTISSDVSANGGALAAHQIEIAALNASLAAAAARLASAEGRLVEAEAGIVGVQAGSQGSNASVAQLRLAVDDLRGQLNTTNAALFDARLNLSHVDGQVSALEKTGSTASQTAASGQTWSLFAIALGAAALVACVFLAGRGGKSRGGPPQGQARDAEDLDDEEE